MAKNIPKQLQNGLVMWLDGNGKDLSGNGNNGTITGATKQRVLQNDGLTYSGSTQYVNIPNSTALQLVGNYTQSIWVYQSGAATQRLMQKDNSNDYSGGWGLQIYSNLLATDHNYGSNQQFTTGLTITPNVWTHIVQTYDGANRIVYINGVSRATKATTTNVVGEAGNNVFLGCYGDTGALGQYYTGKLINPMIWNRALSATEIQLLHEATFIK